MASQSESGVPVTDERPVCVVVGCAAPLITRVFDVRDTIEELGWRTQPILTPQAATWLDDDQRAAVTVDFRSPSTPRRLPRPSAAVIAPLTLNSANKIVAGIADNYALNAIAEILSTGNPIVAVPMISARLWTHPLWEKTQDTLTAWGVRMVDLTTGGPLSPSDLDQGDALADTFDPQWIRDALGPPILPRQANAISNPP